MLRPLPRSDARRVILTVEPHPLLHLEAFEARLPAPLAELPSPPWLVGLFHLDAPALLAPGEEVRLAIRDLLRGHGYKPAGRGKPASEYLARAAADGALGSINLVVDACNVASLHSGLPMSVVDLDLVELPLRVGVAESAAEYVFNASGQTIRVGGLLSLHDARGPCAGPVKDSHRTKTHGGTRRVLAIVWGHREHAERAAAAAARFRELLERAGAECEGVTTRLETP
jgi:DNA/RNA-binding domain of Phe-tRNA-synthetase-like protein